MRKTVEPQIGTSIDLQLAGGSSGCLIPAKALKLGGLSSGPREPSVKTLSIPPPEHGMEGLRQGGVNTGRPIMARPEIAAAMPIGPGMAN